jgi:hypothetical protein
MRRLVGIVLAIGGALGLSACSAMTTGTSDVTNVSAKLHATASCDSGQTCTWYWEYWLADAPRSTSTKTPVFGPVSGPTGKVPLSVDVKGLNRGTTYRWVFCGSPNNGGAYVCAGPKGKFSSTTADPPTDYGTFTTGQTLAEVWDGNSWAIGTIADPSAGAGGSFLNGVSCTSASACTAVGGYVDSSGATVQFAERWDGTSWTIQSTPNPSGSVWSVLSAVSCTSGTACTAVGHYSGNSNGSSPSALVERWGGTSWSIQPTPTPSGGQPSELLSVSCTSATACTAVGDYGGNFTSSTDFMLAERWDGATWAIQPIPGDSGVQFGSDELQGVSCTSDTACQAVGTRARADSSFTQAARWDGTSWTIEPTPDVPNGGGFGTLAGVSCASATACKSVGSYQGPGGSTLTENWDGTSWTLDAPPTQSTPPLAGISCTSSTACTAVGASAAERWDGTSWTIQPTPDPGGLPELSGVSCSSAAACTAVGSR